MLELILPVIISLIYTMSCIFLGLIISRYIKYNPDLPGAFLIGLGSFTFVLLCIGFLHLFSFIILISIIYLIILLGIRKLYQNFSKNTIYNYFKISPIFKIIFGILLLITGIRALIFQPLGDSAAYYMVLPKLIAASHQIMLMPGYESFGQLSFFNELHYAALISLGGVYAAKFFIWIVFLVAIMILFQIGNKIKTGLYGKYIILAILITSFAFTDLIFTATVDWFAAAFGLAACYQALKFSEKEEILPLILAGFFSGLAVIGKISYAYTFLPGILVLLYWHYLSKISLSWNIIKEHIRSVIKTGIIFCCGGFIPVSANMIKNYLLFNQPFIPFILTGYETGLSQIWYTAENALWIIITYPFALVFGTYPMQGGTISPLFLAFLPLVFLLPASIRQTNFNKIAICSLICIIMSIVVTPYIFAPRYLMVPLLLSIVIVATATGYFISQHSLLSALIILFTIIVLAITLFSSLTSISSTVEHGECAVIGPICNASHIINKQASNDNRICLLGYYSYWLKDNLIVNLSSRQERDYVQFISKSPDERAEYLYNRNFTYIFSDGSFKNVSQDFTTQHSQNITTTKIFEEQNVIVFKINKPTTTI